MLAPRRTPVRRTQVGAIRPAEQQHQQQHRTLIIQGRGDALVVGILFTVCHHIHCFSISSNNTLDTLNYDASLLQSIQMYLAAQA